MHSSAKKEKAHRIIVHMHDNEWIPSSSIVQDVWLAVIERYSTVMLFEHVYSYMEQLQGMALSFIFDEYISYAAPKARIVDQRVSTFTIYNTYML